MQTQVTPQYVNQPKQPGGKYGNIKLQDGTLYMVPTHALANFAPGTVANIEFGVQNWGQPPNQKPFNVVTGINGVPITGQAGPVRGGDQPAAMPPSVPLSPMPKVDTAEDIFVTGIVGRAMGSGKFGMDDILGLTQRARAAWENRHTRYPEGPPDESYGLDVPPGDPYGP